MVCMHEKKNHSIRCWGKKAKQFSNNKSKLIDFGEGCSWQVRAYTNFGELQ